MRKAAVSRCGLADRLLTREFGLPRIAPRKAPCDATGAESPPNGRVRTVFVDYPPYFDRDFLYGTAGQDYPDNPERFAFLAVAALEWAASTARPFDVVHAHDWQAGLVPVLLRTGRAPCEARAHADGFHDSQPRVSGRLRRELVAAARLRLGSDAHRRAGVLGTNQLSEGRD